MSKIKRSHFTKENFFLILFWFLGFLVLLTPEARPELTLLEKGTLEYFILLIFYLLGGILLWATPRVRPMTLFNMVLALFLFSLKLRSSFLGRDAVLLIYSGLFLHLLFTRCQVRLQVKVLITSLLLSVFLSEAAIGTFLKTQKKKQLAMHLPDYGDIPRGARGGGFFTPNLNFTTFGEFGKAQVITNQFGFRNDYDIDPNKDPSLFRAILLGDSMMVGYRTDQKDLLGRKLEEKLAGVLPQRKPQVLIAGANYLIEYLNYIKSHAFQFNPDLIILGLTLGNDLYPSLPHRADAPPDLGQKIHSAQLPQDAYSKSSLRKFFLKIHRSYHRWDLYRLLWRILLVDRVVLYGKSRPYRVHLFDPNRAVGPLYKDHKLNLIELANEDALDYLKKMNDLCQKNKVSFLVILLPQSFQVDRRLFNVFMFEYGLDGKKFNWDFPNLPLGKKMEENKILFFDPLASMRKAHLSFFMPGDMHFNAQGQNRMAEYLSEFIRDHIIQKD